MREPIPIEPPASPGPSQPIGTGLQVPTPEFIDELCKAIRGGASPYSAAMWLGVLPRHWRLWRRRRGSIYGAMHQRILQAQGHLETGLLNKIASANPLLALKTLRADAAEHERTRQRRIKERPWEAYGLTMPQEVFCQSLAADPDNNAFVAIKKIKEVFPESSLNGLRQRASKMKKDQRIQRRVADIRAEQLARKRVTRENVIGELADAAFAKPVDDVTWDVKLKALSVLAQITEPPKTDTPIHGVNFERAIVYLPDNHRDALPEGTNGSHSSESSELAILDFPARDDFVKSNGEPKPDSV